MRQRLSCATLLLSLAMPSVLHAQWYGWDHACQGSVSWQACATVQIQTAQTGSGTEISVRMQSYSPDALWGGPKALLFSKFLRGMDPFGTWFDNSAAFFIFDNNAPSYGGWTYFSISTPFTVHTTDLRGFEADVLSREDLENGGPTFELQYSLRNPTVPEPASLVLLGTGLLALAGFRMRRRNQRGTEG